MTIRAFLLAGVALVLKAQALEPCRIEVVEQGSGWPVPLVELRTTHGARLVTDNAGVIACDLPELMGVETWFEIRGHGYGVAADGFGMRGVRLRPEPGATVRVEVSRQQIARRLGRLTGAGLFAESRRTGADPGGEEAPGIFGCDSVQNAVHRGRLYWAWGDTTLPHYPLGVFHMTSATTPIRPLKSFEPPIHIAFGHFREGGRPAGVAEMPGSGPTWVSGYVSLPDTDGGERLVGTYLKIRNHLEAYELGLCVWEDERERFARQRVVWQKSAADPQKPLAPEGHPAFWTDDAGVRWVYFGNPFPFLRCPATYEAWSDPDRWERLEPQPTVPEAGSGRPVIPHTGHIAWNPWRGRWVTVFMQKNGTPSALGELWYAEADHPTGPWGAAVKVVTHDNYTFYNPRLHPEFTPEDSPVLLFEGTYTAEFADRPEPTPRYNYNQILYRLDLDDLALAPAQSGGREAGR